MRDLIFDTNKMKTCYYCGLCADQGWDRYKRRYCCIREGYCKNMDYDYAKKLHREFEECFADHEELNPNWANNSFYAKDRARCLHKIQVIEKSYERQV